jgi:prevent-host-death family protein
LTVSINSATVQNVHFVYFVLWLRRKNDAMEQTLGVTEARIRFAELVDQVRYQGDTVTLLKSGKPAAVLVPVELFERWKAERTSALAAMRAIQANATRDTEALSDEEAMELALEAQNDARKNTK